MFLGNVKSRQNPSSIEILWFWQYPIATDWRLGDCVIGSLPFVDLNFHIRGILRLEDEALVLEWRRVRGWPFIFSPFPLPR